MEESFGNSFESEVAILSIILKDNDRAYDLKHIKGNMFSSTPHKILFSTISDILARNLIPDYGFIVNSLKSNNILDQIGGEEYLKYLLNQTYDPQNLEEFERIVINSFKSATVLKISKQSEALLYKPAEVDNIIASIRDGLDKLDLSSNIDSTESISNCLDLTVSELKKRMDFPGPTGKSTGIKSLDYVTNGFTPGDLWLFAGRPSHGKSAIMCNSALKGKNKCLIFSLEMRKQNLMERFLAIRTNISLSDIRFGNIDKKNIDKISDAIDELRVLPIYIDSNFSANLDYIISAIRKYKRLYDIDVVYIDYIGLLATDKDNETHELGIISRRLKLLANDLEISIVILSQLNRLVEMRDDKRPILSDLRQSGSLEQDADVVIMFYRDELYNKETKENKNKIEFLIRKQRNGPVGMLAYKFIPETNVVEES